MVLQDPAMRRWEQLTIPGVTIPTIDDSKIIKTKSKSTVEKDRWKQLNIPNMEIPDSKYAPSKTFKDFSQLFFYFKKNSKVKGGKMGEHGSRILRYLVSRGIAERQGDSKYGFREMVQA